MNQRDLELALRKQRLLIHSQALREQWGAQAQALRPVATGVDRVRAGVRWMRAHPQAIFAGALVLGVLRPRAAFRWARRGFVIWGLWRKLRQHQDVMRERTGATLTDRLADHVRELLVERIRQFLPGQGAATTRH
jgi:hypothetical protein